MYLCVPFCTVRSQLSNKSQDEERDGRGEEGCRRSQKAGRPIQRGTQGSSQRRSPRFIHHTIHLSKYRYIRYFKRNEIKKATQSIQMRQCLHDKKQREGAYCFAPVNGHWVGCMPSVVCIIHIIRTLCWIDDKLLYK